MHLNKLKYPIVNQAAFSPQFNRLAEGVDVLVLDFFINKRSE